MKILLAQLLSYLFTPGGAHKANRLLIEQLAAKGHPCWVVASSLEPGPQGRAQLLTELAQRNIKVISATADVVVFYHQGVKVYTVTGEPQTYRRLLPKLIREFKPAWTLVSEDRTFLLLEAALAVDPTRVIYVAHSQATLPFGPESFSTDSSKGELLRQTAGILTVSQHLKKYLREWGGLDSVVLPFPAYGPGPFPYLGRFDTGFVTMINPSAIKGLSIFMALAQRLPHVQFAVVPTWATTDADRLALNQLPNVHWLEPSENVDEFLAQTRILLVPSLWGEAFALVVNDAMVRGIPVLASNVGGLPEAKLGVEHVLPVHPIERYEEHLDEKRLPVPIVPKQDLGPWLEALQGLLSNRAEYERLSVISREAALKFVTDANVERFEKFLEARARTSPVDAVPVSGNGNPELHGLINETENLTPETRSTLLAFLRKKIEEPRTAPLSLNQEQLWFLEHLGSGDPFYNMPSVTRLTGRLEAAILEQSLNQLGLRHEALRISLVTEKETPIQVIAPTLNVSLPVKDLRELPRTEREAEARRLINETARRPLNLRQSPLWRATLLRLDEKEFILILIVHHLISDGWSMNILLRDLAELYQAAALGRPASLATLAVSYADFCRQQREQLESDSFEAQLAYWEQQLADAPPALDLPADHPRPAVQTYRGTHQHFVFSKTLGETLNALSKRQGATLFMTWLAAFKVLLYRYTGQTDICVGTLAANRKRAELEPLVGFLANTLVLRTQLDGQQTFLEVLDQVRTTTLGAYDQSDVPFGKLVERLQPKRDPSRSPFFQVLFFETLPISNRHLNGMILSPVEVDAGGARFDLTLTMRWEPQQGLLGTFGYNTDLFESQTITRLIEHFRNLLESLAQCPNQRIAQASLLTEAERRQLLIEWNNTRADYPHEQCVHALFEAQVECTPEAIALALGEQQVTYRELNRRANQLAHYLRTLGVGPESIVGICVERSLEMVVGVLGVLKAGGAYLPLDTTYPEERLAFMVADARIKVLVTDSRLLAAGRWPLVTTNNRPPSVISLDTDWERIANDQQLVANSQQPATSNQQPAANNLAYLIYTSGSTGRPKGVAVAHTGLGNLVEAQKQAFDVCSDSRVLQFASFSFDASVSEIFVTLLSGATLCLGTQERLAPGPDLMGLMRDQAITTVTLPPSVLAVLPDELLPDLQTIVAAGEACPAGQVARWSPGRRFLNAYGPTEATVCATMAECLDHNQKPSIGSPMANVQTYILDAHLQPVPIGVPGELHISSVGLARGYLGRPELTAERFVPNPFAGKQAMSQDALSLGLEPWALAFESLRLYKTGDLARYLPGGNIEFLGRIDHQVKVRGFRIELGEVEAALSQHPAVQETVVVVWEGEAGQRLVAYAVSKEGQKLTVEELRRFLQARLPAYMLPSTFILLEAMPLTPHGKIDRRCLPPPNQIVLENPTTFVAPQTPTEAVLADIWAQTLGIKPIGIHDNFFDLGGHSLVAVQVRSRVREILGVEISLPALFESPTVAQLAQTIELARREGQAAVKATTDLSAEVVLDPGLCPEALPPAAVGEPANIFLTGATGFLGAFLLHELLQQTRANIYCLVRASSLDDGRRRLQQMLATYGLWDEAVGARIIPVPGNLSEPFLGLAEAAFSQLAGTLDVIYHNGAQVNFVYPYATLKATNVLGTQEALRLACRTKAKPVHYVSTLSVAASLAQSESPAVSDDETSHLQTGYAQSKWVAEQLVMLAGSRGLPVSIYRPGRITGHSQTGVCNTDDLLWRMIKGCIQLGTVPDLENLLVDITPVDYVSQAIVYLSRRTESVGQTFPLLNPCPVPWQTLVAEAASLGYPLRQVSYEAWRTELLQVAGHSKENALASLLSIFPERLAQGPLALQAEVPAQTKTPPFQVQPALDLLKGASIFCPPADSDLLNTYFAYCRNCGFLSVC